jgi:hypothetical protein
VPQSPHVMLLFDGNNRPRSRMGSTFDSLGLVLPLISAPGAFAPLARRCRAPVPLYGPRGALRAV